ncbi:hypothetical protein DWQ65_11000 [Treponema phagedenis]|nr:hypothetical protein DWQ65_11000 [Treponema phagedenis]
MAQYCNDWNICSNKQQATSNKQQDYENLIFFIKSLPSDLDNFLIFIFCLLLINIPKNFFKIINKNNKLYHLLIDSMVYSILVYKILVSPFPRSIYKADSTRCAMAEVNTNMFLGGVLCHRC